MDYNILVCGCSASSADAPRIPDMSSPCIYYPSNHELQSNAKSLPREVLKHTCCTWTFGGHTWVRRWSRCLPELFSVGDPILNWYCACRCTAGPVSRGLTWALGWLVFWGHRMRRDWRVRVPFITFGEWKNITWQLYHHLASIEIISTVGNYIIHANISWWQPLEYPH